VVASARYSKVCAGADCRAMEAVWVFMSGFDSAQPAVVTESATFAIARRREELHGASLAGN
jgi:hypothetical protein